MSVIRYHDGKLFCDAAMPRLLEREAENNLMISIALRIADGTGIWGDDPPHLCAIEQEGDVVAAVVHTPPYNLQLTRMSEDAVRELVDHLLGVNHKLTGVMGPIDAVEEFAARWAVANKLQARRDKGLGVYQLRKVVLPPTPSGHSELATSEHEDMLTEWIRDFNQFVGAGFEDARKMVQKGITNSSLWLWKDPDPVSVATAGPRTPHGARIGGVYTPPACRGRGYASANVAQLTQRLLDSGREFCYLFTDIANPTSNSIYRKIGYEQVCEFATIHFEAT